METSHPPFCLTVAETAELTRRGEKAIRAAIASGELIAGKNGTKYAIRPAEIEAWLIDIENRGR